jgi:hypothetical protein
MAAIYPWVALGSLRAHKLTHGYLLRPLHGLKWFPNSIDVPSDPRLILKSGLDGALVGVPK